MPRPERLQDGHNHCEVSGKKMPKINQMKKSGGRK